MALLHAVSQYVVQDKYYFCFRGGRNYDTGVACLKSEFSQWLKVAYFLVNYPRLILTHVSDTNIFLQATGAL